MGATTVPRSPSKVALGHLHQLQGPRCGNSCADTVTLSSLVSLGQHPEHSQNPSHLQAEDGLALVPKEVLLDALQANKYITTPAEEIQKLFFKEYNFIKGL